MLQLLRTSNIPLNLGLHVDKIEQRRTAQDRGWTGALKASSCCARRWLCVFVRECVLSKSWQVEWGYVDPALCSALPPPFSSLPALSVVPHIIDILSANDLVSQANPHQLRVRPLPSQPGIIEIHTIRGVNGQPTQTHTNMQTHTQNVMCGYQAKHIKIQKGDETRTRATDVYRGVCLSVWLTLEDSRRVSNKLLDALNHKETERGCCRRRVTETEK